MAYEPGQRAYEGYTKAIQSEFGTLNWDELPEYIKNTWIAVEQCCQQPQTVNTRKTFRPFAEKELALGQEVFFIVNNQFCQDINWQNQTEQTQFQWAMIARDLRNVFTADYQVLCDERAKAIQVASREIELADIASKRVVAAEEECEKRVEQAHKYMRMSEQYKQNIVALEDELNQLKCSAITQMVIQFADGCPLTINPAHIRQITGQYPSGVGPSRACLNCGHTNPHNFGHHNECCGEDTCPCENYQPQ